MSKNMNAEHARSMTVPIDNAYLSIEEVAALTGMRKDGIRVGCRENTIYGARKCGGRWLIPFASLWPVLEQPEHSEANDEIKHLRREFSLSQIQHACSILTDIDRYQDLVCDFVRAGMDVGNAQIYASKHCSMSLYRIQRLSSEYNRSGLRGIIAYEQALRLVTAEPIRVGRVSADSIVEDSDGPLSIRWYMDLLDGYTDKAVEGVRCELGKRREGQEAIGRNPNKHLYAAGRPTRRENLERIEYQLTSMNPFVLFDLLASIRLGSLLVADATDTTELY